MSVDVTTAPIGYHQLDVTFKTNYSCLIWPNQSTADGPYPVLVWFHGGSYQLGANIQYPGHFLAGKGTVVVVPNYRLGILGFATTADAASPGNYGMLDQVFALKWVQRNIAAFGGDPNRVTIFGESAGGASTGLHLVSKLSRGQFDMRQYFFYST